MTTYNVRLKVTRTGGDPAKAWEIGYCVIADDPIAAEGKALATASNNLEDVHRIVSVKENP